MAELIWMEPALSDLDAIADYIALDKQDAARALVRRIFVHVEQLQGHPESGSPVREVPNSTYRQIVEPPCRIFYRFDGPRIVVVHVMRGEIYLRAIQLRRS